MSVWSSVDRRREMVIQNESTRTTSRGARVTAMVVWLVMCGGAAARAHEGSRGGEQYCSATANALFGACRAQVQADDGVAVAVCINVSDAGERARCLAEAAATKSESQQLCRGQR